MGDEIGFFFNFSFVLKKNLFFNFWQAFLHLKLQLHTEFTLF